MRHYPLHDYRSYDTIVLANGAFPRHAEPLKLIDEWAEDVRSIVLASCDGATTKLLAYQSGKLPDLVVGDLDSLSPELKERLADRITHVGEQETNDLTKTITHLYHQYGKRRILLLGATGEREDHTLANLALLPTYAPLVEELCVLTDTGYFRLIQEDCSLEVARGTQLSVFNFALTPISLEGVQWPLQDYTLPQLWCGSLNRATETSIRVRTSSPLLLFIARS